MLDALKFVQGAVAKKDFVPALTHFHIGGGRIKGFNGKVALSCPIDLNLDAAPKAVPFIKAVQTCKDTVQLNMTPTGRLSIKSGGFKAFIDCVDNASYPDVQPEGEVVRLDGEFLKALKVLAPFIADDASRPWARGILFRGMSATATNNIVILEYWLGYPFPAEINVPKAAVQELLRIGEEPTHLQVSESNVTFHFEGDRWLRTQVYDLSWPDVGKVLNRDSEQAPVPEGFFPSLLDLTPFVDELGRIFLREGRMTTTPDEGIGATVELPGLPADGCFHHKQLSLLEGVADSIDFAQYPAPCMFYGDRVRGAIVGMRI